MMYFKRLIICLFSSIIFFNCIPGLYTYSADSVDQWQNCSTLELQTQAFLAYCKSRDLTIDGSALDVVTKFTTQTYQNAQRGVGLNVNAIQSDIKYSTDRFGGLQFLFNDNGATAMNRIFSQFLQDNNLSVGDEVENTTLYSGSYYVDPDGNGCLVTIMGTNATSVPAAVGSPYIYDEYTLQSLVTNSYTSTPFSWSVNYYDTAGELKSYTYEQYYYLAPAYWLRSNKPNGQTFNYSSYYASRSTNTVIQRGYPSIVRIPSGNNAGLYLGFYTYPVDPNSNYSIYYDKKIGSAADTSDANVFIYSPTINNNTYDGNTYTTINYNGDVNNYYDQDEPDPDDPVYPDPDNPSGPSGGTPPNWDVGGGDGTLTDPDGNTWNINFPDFELPDLNIDWSINGLGNKFPFSIPFDLVALVTVLNAEPQAPRFQGTVNFGFTTWDYDVNLQPFDTVASVCRIAELLLLVFGLIMVTRSIIKG